jgi:hypothetical protein
LAKLKADDVVTICHTDDTIKDIGKKLFQELPRKREKKTEVRHSTMTSMWKLGRLFLAFRDIAIQNGTNILSAEDMFNRTNFSYLEDALGKVTTSETNDDCIKGSLKLSIRFLLKKAQTFLKSRAMIQDEDLKVIQFDKFSALLNLNWSLMFVEAECKAVKARQTRLRKPARLSVEDDINKVRDYTLETMSKLLDDPYTLWTRQQFSTRLRDATLCRITLYNARRAGSQVGCF